MSESASPIRVRRADLADLEMIVSFNQAMALETEERRLDRATLQAGVAQALKNSGHSLYFLAEVGGVPAGQMMLTFEWSDWRNGFFWWIQSVYVDPRFRRRGVFRSLYAHVRDHAQADGGVCGLRLYVHHDNHLAMRTYEQLGMKRADYLMYEKDWSK
jgi:ribosomal protein S18 acetylase RimI-like enzyme